MYATQLYTFGDAESNPKLVEKRDDDENLIKVCLKKDDATICTKNPTTLLKLKKILFAYGIKDPKLQRKVKEEDFLDPSITIQAIPIAGVEAFEKPMPFPPISPAA